MQSLPTSGPRWESNKRCPLVGPYFLMRYTKVLPLNMVGAGLLLYLLPYSVYKAERKACATRLRGIAAARAAR